MTTRDDLYAKFGITAEAAQLFETELGTILLVSRALEEGWHIEPDAEIVRAELVSINSSTLGRVLGRLKAVVQFDDETGVELASALKARNRLTHGFFLKHGTAIQSEKGRGQMVEELEEIHTELFNAWQLASAMSAMLIKLLPKVQNPN